MTDREMGIEDARKILGQLADEASWGHKTHLTRMGRRVAVITSDGPIAPRGHQGSAAREVERSTARPIRVWWDATPDAKHYVDGDITWAVITVSMEWRSGANASGRMRVSHDIIRPDASSPTKIDYMIAGILRKIASDEIIDRIIMSASRAMDHYRDGTYGGCQCGQILPTVRHPMDDCADCRAFWEDWRERDDVGDNSIHDLDLWSDAFEVIAGVVGPTAIYDWTVDVSPEDLELMTDRLLDEDYEVRVDRFVPPGGLPITALYVISMGRELAMVRVGAI